MSFPIKTVKLRSADSCLFRAGYARIVLAIVSFYFMPTNYIIASWCYIISVLLDALDGHAARKFNQCTKPYQWVKKKLIDKPIARYVILHSCRLHNLYDCWMLVSYQFQRRNSVQCWINWPTDAARWAYWWRLAISIRSTCFGSSCRWRLMLRVTGFTYTRET